VKNFIKTVKVAAGIAAGPGVVALVYKLVYNFASIDLYTELSLWLKLCIFVASGIISGIIFFIFSENIAQRIVRFTHEIERRITKASFKTVMFGAGGLIFGLLVAFLLSWLVKDINTPLIAMPINSILYFICIYVGTGVAVKLSAKYHVSLGEEEAQTAGLCPKLLDTSVIIDGRIFDILKTGVMEGTIVIPEFVLAELRHIADSSDALRRGRGRRGLDILNRIQKELDVPIRIVSKDPEDLIEVDAKLLRLAQEMGGKVVTNDYNLNKVASVQGVGVININELSNAVKSVLLPGEEIHVSITKKGREGNQGIAYLEDGTMIVVENAGGMIGEEADVTVTSALQTAAGRMIFAKLR
jgi:uncharacterized protein YacL